jgi:hypothetical protein
MPTKVVTDAGGIDAEKVALSTAIGFFAERSFVASVT